MKSFEDYLQRGVVQRMAPDGQTKWSEHYMNYGALKLRLKRFYKRRKEFKKMLLTTEGALRTDDFELLVGRSSETTETSSEASSSYFQYIDEDLNVSLVDREDARLRISVIERQEFSALIEGELVKAATFYTVQLLPALLNTIDDHEKGCRDLLQTTAFCVANIITFRQILIRYDAFCRSYEGMPLTEWHLQRSVLAENHPVHDLFQLNGLHDVEARLIYQMQNKGVDCNEVQIQLEQFRVLLEKTHRSIRRVVAGHTIWKDRFLSMVRGYFLFGLQGYGLQLEPNILVMRGHHLKKEMQVVAEWQEARGALTVPKTFKNEEKKPTVMHLLKTELEPSNRLPLLLNLFSCFLFMMNNYIIEPSSAYYAAALGSSDALAGIMIGAAPWFAMMSAIAYSYWTNSSYKTPIVFASTLMFIGNLIYSAAYTFQSMPMCLIGRAITGLGAPRVINRRYVADATPFSLRTVASAAFCLSTALGAALGPGMAILLDLTPEFEFDLPLLGRQYFNGMTGPGYFMAVCWGLYMIVILITFNEPIRSGLDELREREETKASYKRENSVEDFVVVGTPNYDAPVAKNFSSSFSNTNEEIVDDEASDDESDDGSKSSAISDASTLPITPTCCPGPLGHLTRPVLLCMSLIFMKRIALESIVGSTSVITKNRYGWTIANVGFLHLVNGTIVIPVSALSGWLSTFYEDRYMTLWFLGVTLAGMIIMVDWTDLYSYGDTETYNEDLWLSVGPVKYIIGSIIAFSGIEACESYVASLMSKVVPSALAVGTFNSGLLATLVGTGGRAFGDLFITLMGLISIRNLLNLLILPGAALVVLSMVLIRYNYSILAV